VAEIGGFGLSAMPHLANKSFKLRHWFCHDSSTVGILSFLQIIMIIIFIIIILSRCAYRIIFLQCFDAIDYVSGRKGIRPARISCCPNSKGSLLSKSGKTASVKQNQSY